MTNESVRLLLVRGVVCGLHTCMHAKTGEGG